MPIQKMSSMAADAVDTILKRGQGSIKVRNVSKTREEMDTALAAVDQDAIINEEDARFTTEIWDGVSPINGVSASQIMRSRKDIPQGGKVYLVKDGERVVIFQPHDPDVAGHVAMDDVSVALKAADTRQSHANDCACDRILRAVADELEPPT